jgi:hypothetical protein
MNSGASHTRPELAQLSPATLDEHQADTFGEHVFVNVLSPWSSSVAP